MPKATALVRTLAGATIIVVALAGALPVSAQGKSGLGPDQVILPTGPGSVNGFGPDYDPDLPNGSATLDIEIEVPPGVAGFNPELSLSYDSGNGNGIFGFGWDMGLYTVERRSSLPLPRYVDGPNGIDDDYDGVIDNDEEIDAIRALIGGWPINLISEDDLDPEDNLEPQGSGFFFTAIQSDFVRYKQKDDHWCGAKPDGYVFEFGLTDQSRVIDPEDPAKVFSWQMEKEFDLSGNMIEYIYERSSADNSNTYISRIEWGVGGGEYNTCSGDAEGEGSADGEGIADGEGGADGEGEGSSEGEAGGPRPHFHFIKFVYEARPDAYETMVPGFVLRETRRIKSIVVGTQTDELPGHLEGDFNEDGIKDFLVRRYDIRYDTHPYWSLISSITQVGADGITALPAMSLSWRVCDPPQTLDASTAIIEMETPPLTLPNNPAAAFTEINGDGLPDILVTNPLGGAHRAILNLGPRAAALGQVVAWGSPTPVGGDERAYTVDLANDDTIAELVDMDGDGFTDLAYKAGPFESYYFPQSITNGQTSWGQRKRMNLGLGESAPPSPFETVDVERGDFNADKRMDVAQTIDAGGATQLRIWYNLSEDRFSKPVTINQPFNWMLSHEGVSLTDFNGDGIDDMVRVRPTRIEVYPGVGYGKFAEMRIAEIPDYTLLDRFIEQAELEDLTGDGFPELQINGAEPGVMWYWVGHGDYTFEPRRTITGLPIPRGNNPTVDAADLNGDGADELVYIDDASGPRMVAVDIGKLMGCVPAPNLLLEVDNGHGQKTAFQHVASTQFLLEDAANGEPWTDPLPFSAAVVSRVDTTDTFGNVYSKLYRYRDGFYDTRFKAFAGFGGVEFQDIGDAVTPTEARKYVFDVGRGSTALRGSELEERSEGLDGNVQWIETTEWTIRELGAIEEGEDEEGSPIEVAFPARETRQIFESGRGEPRTTEREFTYDNYGNILEERDYGIVVGGDRSAFNDEKITRNEYALNIVDWLVRYPKRTEVTDLAGNVVSRTETYYDDEPLGITLYGGVTQVDRWLDPADPEAYVSSERLIWGDYGNVQWFIDGLGEFGEDGELVESAGHYRYVEFDPKFQTYPIREEIHLGGEDERVLTIEADYNPGLGVVTASRDFSGNETRHEYDSLARPTRVFRPGDDTNYPSMEYRYRVGVQAGGGVINAVETRMLDRAPNTPGLSQDDHYRITTAYINGLGETVLEKEEAESSPEDNEPRVVVKGAVAFNGRGKVRYMLNPFYTTLTGTLEEQLAFENILTPGWLGQFESGGVLTPLSFADAHRVESLYDVELRPTRVTAQDGTYRESVYEPLLTKVYDENDTDAASPYFDTPLVHVHDGQDRLVRVDEITRLNDDGTLSGTLNTWSTHYDYRADGVRTRMIDSQQNQKLMTYDGMGRLIALNDPNQGVTTYAYDAAGNLTSRIDALRREIAYTYDGANRKLTEDQRDETETYSLGYAYNPEQPLTEDNRPDIAYFYDDPVPDLDLGDGTTGTAENTLGRLAFIWDQAGEHHTSYDNRARITWTMRSLRDPRSEQLSGYQTQMEYDAMDRVVAVLYPDGDRVDYAYNERGLMESISGGALANDGGQDVVVNGRSYAPNGQRLTYVFGNGNSSIYGHDTRKRLTSIRTVDAERNTLLNYTYDYDKTSNIQQITDLRPADLPVDGDARRNHQRFGYDDMYRLTGVDYGRDADTLTIGAAGSIGYQYDRLGNLLVQSSDIDDTDGRFSKVNLGTLAYGGPLGASGRVGRAVGDAPGPHALTFADDGAFTRTFEYDDVGNMTRVDDLGLTWNHASQMVVAEDNAMRAEYVYDYAGERALKMVYAKNENGAVADAPSNVTQYVAKYFEVREGEQPVKYVYDGEDRVARALGTLDPTSERVQRFRFAPGWNLAAMGVEAGDAAVQLGLDAKPEITGAFVWDAGTGDYLPLDSTSALPGGSVFWVYADEAFHVAVRGQPVPSAQEAAAAPGFNVLRALHALRPAAALPDTLNYIWAFDADTQAWRARLSGDNDFLSDLPDFIQAGQPIFLAFNDPATLEFGGPELDLQYYHGDHLGSANLVTDANGGVIEETAFYPFGEPRNQFKADRAEVTLPNPYLFSQKERDTETGLHYFETRYLAATLARFNRVDPMAEAPTEAMLADPQQQHAYAYARNNPITFTDPDGRFVRTKAGQVLMRQFNPFSDQGSGNLSDNKAQRRARVFGQLQVDKGGTLFGKGGQMGAGSIPDFAQKEIEKLKLDFSATPNQLISDVEKFALKLKAANPDPKKLDVSQFLNAITSKPGDKGVGANLLAQFGTLSADPKKLKDSAITESGSIANAGIAKQIGDLQGKLKGMDLDGKLKELTEKGNKGLKDKGSEGFNFDQAQVDAFIDKYLGGADTATELNRLKKDDKAQAQANP
jgi:RHS repeat-associated protein